MNEEWIKEIERRLFAVEVKQAVDTASKEHMDIRFKELSDEFKGFRDDLNRKLWGGVAIVGSPFLAAFAYWVLNGGLAGAS